MKRTTEHVTDERARRLLVDLLPPEWIPRDLPQDYGVDYEVELVDQAVVSGNRIWLQLKGTAKAPAVRDLAESGAGHDQVEPQRYISASVSTKLLEYSLRCGFPLLLFLADLEREDVYWLPPAR